MKARCVTQRAYLLTLRLIDAVAMVPAALAALLLGRLRRFGFSRPPLTRRVLQWAGVTR